MDKSVKEKLSMYGVVRQLLGGNQSSWNTIPAFVSVYDQYVAKLEELKVTGTMHDSITKGKGTKKRSIRAEVVGKARVITSALVVMATNAKNYELLESLPTKKRDLEYASQSTLFNKLELIKEAVENGTSELIAHGITEEYIEQFIQKSIELEEVVFTPREGIAKRKALTVKLKSLVKELDELLQAGLDQMMQIVGETNPALLKEYVNTRNIVNMPTHHKKDVS